MTAWRYLFRARFNIDDAAPLTTPQLCDIGSMTVIDTGDHVSISGGTLVSDGAREGWADPRCHTTEAWPRQPGRAVLCDIGIAGGGSCQFGWSTGHTANRRGVFVVIKGSTVNCVTGAGEFNVPFDYSGDNYKVAVVQRSSGSVILASADAGPSTIVWVDNADTDTPLYLILIGPYFTTPDNLRLTDLGGAWATDYGIARVHVPTPAAITPTLGAELHVSANAASDPNSNEADAVTGWASYEASEKVSTQDQVNAGSYSIEVTDPVSACVIRYPFPVSIGDWVAYDWYGYNASTSRAITTYITTTGAPAGGFSGVADDTIGSWIHQYGTTRALHTTAYFFPYLTNSGAGDRLMYVDNLSFKVITLSTTLGTVYDKHADYLAEVSPTLTAGTQAGLMLNIDDDSNPANFILAYHDGTNAHLEKCVAGTYTSLINAAASYGAGKRLVVIKDGTSVTLYYNDVKIGATQTVSDAGVKDNTKHSWFSTYASNTFSNFVIWPRTVTLPTGCSNSQSILKTHLLLSD